MILYMSTRRDTHSKLLDSAALLSSQQGRGSVGTSPPEFGVGNGKANCPPQISSYRYKHERYVAFKIRQNPFSVWGSSRRSPRPSSRLGREHPSHTPPHSAPTYLRRSPCVPPDVQPDLRLSCSARALYHMAPPLLRRKVSK